MIVTVLVVSHVQRRHAGNNLPFGNIMTTAMLGSGDSARIAIIPLEKDHKAASYAANGMGS